MHNILQDFDPIKDANWNMEPFHSDYVVPKRKSRIVDPYEMMPVTEEPKRHFEHLHKSPG